MILTVGNTKGGVGKTTLATQLALARQAAGANVLLIDADRQGSAQNAATARSEGGRSPPLACVHLPSGKALRAQIAALSGSFDDILIDAGGQDSQALRVALVRSDLLLVPVQPRAVDVWSVGDIVELIEQAQEAREDEGRAPLRVFAVLNLADPGDNRDTAETLTALAGFPLLTPVQSIIRRRKAVANAMAYGLGVAEMQVRDQKACEEIAQLVQCVFDAGVMADGHHADTKAE